MKLPLEPNKDTRIFIPLARQLRKGEVQLSAEVYKASNDHLGSIESADISKYLNGTNDYMETAFGSRISRVNKYVEEDDEEEKISCVVFHFDDRNHKIGLEDGAYIDVQLLWNYNQIWIRQGIDDFLETQIISETSGNPEELEALLQEAEKKEQKIELLEKQLSENFNASRETRDVTLQQEKKIAELKEETEELRNKLEMKVAEFFSSPERWEDVLSEINREMDEEIRQQSEGYQRKLKESKTLMTEKESEKNALVQQVEEADRQIHVIEEEIGQMTGVIDESAADIEKLKIEKAELESIINEQTADIKLLEEGNGTIREQVNQNKERIDRNQDLLRFIKDSKLDVETTLRTLKMKLGEMEEELNEVENQMGEAIRKKEEKAEEIEDKVTSKKKKG